MANVKELDELIEAVEISEAEINWKVVAGYSAAKWGYCERAFNGSLDAAKALHKALLPGWTWAVYGDGNAHLWRQLLSVNTRSPNPARAWLIAVLKAYRAQQQE